MSDELQKACSQDDYSKYIHCVLLLDRSFIKCIKKLISCFSKQKYKPTGTLAEVSRNKGVSTGLFPFITALPVFEVLHKTVKTTIESKLDPFVQP